MNSIASEKEPFTVQCRRINDADMVNVDSERSPAVGRFYDGRFTSRPTGGGVRFVRSLLSASYFPPFFTLCGPCGGWQEDTAVSR